MEFEEGVSGDGKAELEEVVVQMVKDLRAGGEENMQVEAEMSWTDGW